MASLRYEVAKVLRPLTFAVALMVALHLSAETNTSPRSVLSADDDWKFFLGSPEGAESPAYDDHSWRTVTVPHDWSIEGVPTADSPSKSGEGYFPAGIGWYRKSFTAPDNWKGKRVSLEFDGVSMNATVFLNGQRLGFHPYAYTSCRFDITSDLKYSAANVIAVKVDNSNQPSSRWYSGSGIYRHVRVVVNEPIHVAPWGVFVSTPEVSARSAKVLIKTQVQNDTLDVSEITVRTVLVDPLKKKSKAPDKVVRLQAGQVAEAGQEVTLTEPALWSPKTPHLYKAVTQIIKNGRVLDEVETSFGVRSLSWSVEKGLLLNGESIKLAGGSVHHDNGPLGAAAFDRAEERKAQLLKDAGFNAVRTAHNPPSPAFLDACDRLGVLVVEDAFDVWTSPKVKYDYSVYFKDWWQRDIDSMVLRDRNHPSILMWGIGNEIPEAWTDAGAPIAKQLAERVRSLDSTRPLTEAFPGATYTPPTDAVFAQVDIGGYNYNLAQNQGEDHRRVPDRIMMTTESYPSDIFEQWVLVHEHPYIVGEFVWTAIDYLGESGIGSWKYVSAKQAVGYGNLDKAMRSNAGKMGADGKSPFGMMLNGMPSNPLFPGFPWHAAYCGDLDLTEFRKPSSYYRDILWNGGDRVFATVRLPESGDKKISAIGWSVFPTLPSWTWPGQEGKSMTVEIYSGAESVRLILNDKLLGEKPTGREQAFKADFDVPFEPGILRAEGIRAGKVVTESILETVGQPARIKLTVDRPVLRANGQDLSFVTVEAVDEKGRFQINAGQKVQFEISGAGAIQAVGNGDGESADLYTGNKVSLFNGRAIVVLRTSRKAGPIRLTASGDGLTAASIVVESKQAEPLSELR